LSLLDRGAVFAIAHGAVTAAMGKKWRDQGRMLAKKNTFTVHRGWRTSSPVAILPRTSLVIEGWPRALGDGRGGQPAPDLFKAVVAEVPFVTRSTPCSTPAAADPEYEEWGNPQGREFFSTCCPIRPTTTSSPRSGDSGGDLAQRQPNLMYWGRQICREIARDQTDDNRYAQGQHGRGHGSASGRYDYLRNRFHLHLHPVVERAGVVGGLRLLRRRWLR
jgi:oligopeptidase B